MSDALSLKVPPALVRSPVATLLAGCPHRCRPSSWWKQKQKLDLAKTEHGGSKIWQKQNMVEAKFEAVSNKKLWWWQNNLLDPNF